MDNLGWETIVYEAEDGKVPVQDFLDSLAPKKGTEGAPGYRCAGGIRPAMGNAACAVIVRRDV